MYQLTAGEFELADMIVQGIPCEDHVSAHHSHLAPESDDISQILMQVCYREI